MYSSDKYTGAFVAVVVIGLAGYMVLNVKSDRGKFDALRIGMTTREVQAIVGPRTGSHGRFYTDIEDNDVLHINDVMILTLNNGRLQDKRWIGKTGNSPTPMQKRVAIETAR